MREITFDKMKEIEVDEIVKLVTASGDDKQAEIEAQCPDIDGMAGQGGVTALINTADLYGDETFSRRGHAQGTPCAQGLMPFRNLNSSLSVDSTKVVSGVMIAR